MTDDEIQDEREMTLEEKNRLREILGYGLSAALPLAYHPEDDDATIARLTAQLDAMTKRKDSWRLIALASLRECYAQWVGAEPRDTADYWHEFYLMNSEIRRKMEDVLAGVPIWKVRND